MRKKKMTFLLLMVLLVGLLPACGKEEDENELVLNEVAHSVFYAPQYVAYELGYFEDEGLNVTIVNGGGADKTMTAVLSGEAEVGFMGSEQSVFVYNQGAQDKVVNIAQLTNRAGNFLVARKSLIDDGTIVAARDENGDYAFDWQQLVGMTVVGGRVGGMPQMVFEYILEQKDIAKESMTIIQNIDFGLTGQAFATGTGDFTVEFEPTASSLEEQGVGVIVASCGVESGYVPYTAYCVKESYLEEHPEQVQSFVDALQRGMDYVNTHTPEEIAEVIAPQFEGFTTERLAGIVERYQQQGTWKENLVFEEESYELMLDILELSGELKARAPYEDLVNNRFAEEAAK